MYEWPVSNTEHTRTRVSYVVHIWNVLRRSVSLVNLVVFNTRLKRNQPDPPPGVNFAASSDFSTRKVNDRSDVSYTVVRGVRREPYGRWKRPKAVQRITGRWRQKWKTVNFGRDRGKSWGRPAPFDCQGTCIVDPWRTNDISIQEILKGELKCRKVGAKKCWRWITNVNVSWLWCTFGSRDYTSTGPSGRRASRNREEERRDR